MKVKDGSTGGMKSHLKAAHKKEYQEFIIEEEKFGKNYHIQYIVRPKLLFIILMTFSMQSFYYKSLQ